MPKEVALGQEAGQEAGDIRRYPEKTPNKALEMRRLQPGCGRLPLLLFVCLSGALPTTCETQEKRWECIQYFTVFPVFHRISNLIRSATRPRAVCSHAVNWCWSGAGRSEQRHHGGWPSVWVWSTARAQVGNRDVAAE